MTAVYGRDFSSWDGPITPKELDYLAFVFTKATQGTTYVFEEVHANLATIRKAKRVPGAYHFGDGGDGSTDHGAAQCDFFLDTLGPGRAPFLILDRERNPYGATMSFDQARAFIARGHERGLAIGEYRVASNPSADGDFQFIASWGSRPEVPFSFWQYQAAPDLDMFPGSLAQLQAFAKKVGTPQTPQPKYVARYDVTVDGQLVKRGVPWIVAFGAVRSDLGHHGLISVRRRFVRA